MPKTSTQHAVLSSHALALLVTLHRYPSASKHPSVTSDSAHRSLAELQDAGYLDARLGATPLGLSVVEPITLASSHLWLTTSSPATERHVWLAERSAVIAETTVHQRWSVRVGARSGIWDELVSWLFLSERPQPPRRARQVISATELRSFVRAMQASDEPTVTSIRLAALRAGRRDDVALYDNLLANRARCWLLQARHRDAPDIVEMTAFDGGVTGWWRSWHRTDRPAIELRLDPVDTHEIWRSLSETLHGPVVTAPAASAPAEAK